MCNLYVDRKGIEIRTDGAALAFYDGHDRIGTVPMAPLTRVVLRGDVTFSANLLGKLGAHDIGVIILSGRKAEASLLMGRPHNDARLRLAQYRAAQNDRACLELTRQTVTEKLLAQQALLRHYLEQRPLYRYEITLQLRQIKTQLEDAIPHAAHIGTLRGIEGAAARAFFKAYGKLLPESAGFGGRNRRPPRDPANALLSLGYTLLHNEAVISLHGAGLDPYIGFYHQLDYSRESLACDVIEPLRPLIDRLVIDLLAGQTLRPSHFSRNDKGCFLGKAGRQHFYQEYNKRHDVILKHINSRINDIKQRLHTATGDKAFATRASEKDRYERLSDLL